MSWTPSASGMQRILIVDDEPPIRDVVSTILRYEGYLVDEASDASEALAKLREDPPDLVVLDVMLPDRSGVELTGFVRAQGNAVPIILLTARDALADKVTGLDVGADDYLTKPFVLAELVARVQAILRRSSSDTPAGRLRFVDIELDERSREVHRGGVLIDLTATEFNLLRYFLENPGTVLSKDEILSHVWHYDFDGRTGVVETYVSYLRRKLDVRGPSVIHTVRAVGFILRESKLPA